MNRTHQVLLAFLLMTSSLFAQADWRDLQNGWVVPDENYADQPYFVVLEDGKWLMVLTTGPGKEGHDGQHVVSTTSTDNGRTWTPLTDIEATGPKLSAPYTKVLSSWVIPCRSGFRAPGAAYNRVYAIYVWGHPYGLKVRRQDTHGHYAFRYTDDGGTTWSDRHVIPYTFTNRDAMNFTNGEVPVGWSIDKPTRLNGKMFFGITKLTGVIKGGGGYLYRCDNIDTEGDPTALDWKMLPGTINPDNSVDTDMNGIRVNAWGSVQEEFEIEKLSSGALINVFRTTKAFIGQTISTDKGQTWTHPVPMRFHLNGRIIRHPRANTKIWPLKSGKYLLWHHHNGGRSTAGFRNPVWVSIGTAAGNDICWGEPEVLLYERNKSKRISYPDMMEVDGTMYISATEKGISRVHPIDAGFLSMLDSQPSRATKTTADLQLEETGTLSGSYTMPTLPDLGGYNVQKGFTIETRFQTSNLNADQTIFDTFSGGSGVRMTVNTAGAVDFEMSDGTRSVTLRSDTGTVVAGQPAHISVHVDSPVKLITLVANGRVGDGTNFNTGTGDRTYGYTHFDSAFGDVNGGDIAVGSGLNGTVDLLRVYDRALMHTESIANFRHASGISGPAVTAGIVPSVAAGEPGQSVSFDATHSYVSELTTPVYTWDFGDGSPAVQGAVVNHSYAAAGSYTVTLTISEADTPNLQGRPVATLDFAVEGPTADAVITASGVAASPTVSFSAALSPLANVPDPVYTWDFGDGGSDTGLTVEHTYPLLQDYTVTLTISRAGEGALGGSPVATRVISVGEVFSSVLADINADGTNRTASSADFEAAIGLAAGTLSGDPVLVFGRTEEGGAYSETVSDVTLAISDKSGGADNWFGSGSDNNLLDDGFFNSGATPRTITLSGSGLRLAANRQYELYLFAGRSQGHDTTFRFDVNNPGNPSGGVGIDTEPPVVGGDNTLGTAQFTFATGATPPVSLVIDWDEHAPGVDPVFAGFALRDIGATGPDNDAPTSAP